MVDVGRTFLDRKHAMIEARLLDRGRPARAAGIVGVPVDLQAGVGRGLQQQGEVLAPVAGNHRVGAGGLDLGDVGGEVRHLQQRVQLVADHLDVGTLGLQHLGGGLAHGLAERIVLIDQVDLFDVLLALHVVGQRLHLDVGVGVPAEMRERALLVGQHRIDRGIVEIDHFLAGVALVVFGDPIGERGGNRGAVALGDDARARIDGLLHLHQAFLRIGLVVEGRGSRTSCRPRRPWR